MTTRPSSSRPMWGRSLLALPVAAALVWAGCATETRRPSSTPPVAPDVSTVITWRPLDASVVEQARREDKLILLYVGTSWCHWCHVMDDKTWAAPEVAADVNRNFITVRVDADRDPAILERYAAWGWPATIVLTPEGRDLRRYKGFMDAARTRQELAAVLLLPRDAPVTDRVAVAPPAEDFVDEAYQRATAALDGYYDEERGGWGGPKKYPLFAPMRLALWRAQRTGEGEWATRSAYTLDQLLKLSDPVWGGLYQYSTRNDWDHPHTEKLALIQGRALMMLADHITWTGASRYVDAGRGVHAYVDEHLRSPRGAYFANQDADATTPDGGHIKGPAYYALDDAARRSAGYPRVDRHVFATHTAYIVRGLAAFYMATHDEAVLQSARRAMVALLKTHRGAAGIRHTADSEVLFLADQVHVGRAALTLYEATLEPAYRDLAAFCAAAILALGAPSGDFYADDGSDAKAALFASRRRPFDASSEAAHFLFRMSLLSDVAEKDAYRHAALAAARALSRPERMDREGRGIGTYAVLLADLKVEPLHIAVGGPPGPARTSLLETAHRLPLPGRFIEAVNPGGRFGTWDEAVAFVCGESACSAPVLDAAKLERVVNSFIIP